MKNIHIIPTHKPSKLVKRNLGLIRVADNFTKSDLDFIIAEFVNIYITSDEKIKDVRPHYGKWQLETGRILNKFPNYLTDLSECKLVILTTDQNLIKDGVQAIDDEFLEFIVKNPSCEEVETYRSGNHYDGAMEFYHPLFYKIIIPKEEPKQETLEEAAERLYPIYNRFKYDEDWVEDVTKRRDDFIEGAKWQAERSYSEEEVYQLLYDLSGQVLNNKVSTPKLLDKWFEQFKKK
jgi:hypothetical protein